MNSREAVPARTRSWPVTLNSPLRLSGKSHGEVDEALAKGGKLTPLAALAYWDNPEKGGDVMARMNKYGTWAGDAFKQCNEGAHKEYAGDLKQLINDTEKLAERIQVL